MAVSFKKSAQQIASDTAHISANTPMVMMLKPETEPEITVDMDARTITVPDELKNIGVVADNNAETVYIRIPSTTFDGISLADKTAYVEYINAGGEFGAYEITDKTVEGDSIKLGWTITNSVTRYAGGIKFQLTFELDTHYKWSTIPTAMYIQAGLDIDSTVPKTETSVVTALVSRVTALEEAVNNTISSETEDIKSNISDLTGQLAAIKADVEYLKNHVVYILDEVD